MRTSANGFAATPRRTHIRAVMRSQFLEFKRDFGAVFLTFLFPLFFVVVLVASSLASPRYTMDFGLVNAGNSAEAIGFATALASDNINFRTLDREDALTQLHDGKLSAVVIFPDAKLADGSGKLELVTERRLEAIGRQALEAARARVLLRGTGAGQPYGYTVSTFAQGTDKQFSFIFPGMLALALIQLGLYLTAMPLLRARERGTLRFMLLTPLRASELVLGQVAFRVVIAMCQVALLLLVGSLVISLGLGQWLAVFGVSLLGVLMMVSIGYLLAGLPRSADAGSALIMMVSFAMMFGGNVFWNPEGSPVLTAVAHAMPASYLADLYRQIINGNAGLWSPTVDLLAILVWTVVALVLAARSFRFDMRRNEGSDAPAPQPAE